MRRHPWYKGLSVATDPSPAAAVPEGPTAPITGPAKASDIDADTVAALQAGAGVEPSHIRRALLARLRDPLTTAYHLLRERKRALVAATAAANGATVAAAASAPAAAGGGGTAEAAAPAQASAAASGPRPVPPAEDLIRRASGSSDVESAGRPLRPDAAASGAVYRVPRGSAGATVAASSTAAADAKPPSVQRRASLEGKGTAPGLLYV